MNVIAYDAFPKEELCQQLGFKYVSLDELLANSDIISLHVPYIPSGKLRTSCHPSFNQF